MGIKNSDKHVMRYFVLPLYNIKYNDIKEVYISSYLNRTGDTLFIECLADYNGFANNCLFSGIFPIKGKEYSVFETDAFHAEDVKLIIDGKYSCISKQAKDKIIKLSELDFKRKTKDGKEITSAILLALFKSPVYKKKIEEEIGMELPDTEELISKLKETNFIEEIINQEL